MKANRNIFGIITLLIILGCGCTKEFSPELNLVDKPVVYAIFNSDDSKHFIRISRTFIQAINGETIDAPSYNPDSLEVFLEMFRHNQRIGYPIIMIPELVDKEPGLFRSKDQLIYSAEFDIKGETECRLTILNNQTGESIFSECNLITLDEFKPLFMANFTRIDFKSIENVFFYEASSLFHFVEVSETDTTFMSVSYPNGTVINGLKKAGVPMSLHLESTNWLEKLRDNIQVKPNVRRYAMSHPLEFKLLIGDQFLFDYRRSFSGVETIIHTGQSFSNIQGGFGLFCSYHEKTLFQTPMQAYWYDRLATHPATKDLNFSNKPWE